MLCSSLTAILLFNQFSLIVMLLGFVAPVAVGMVLRVKKKIKSYWAARTTHDRQVLLLINLTFYVILMAWCNAVRIPSSIKIIPLIQIVVMLASLVCLHYPWGRYINGHFAALAAFLSYGIVIGIFTGITVTKPILFFTVLFGIKAYLWLEKHQTNGREIATSVLLGAVVTGLCCVLIG
jgi:membrane-associated HD superfamily phosphohydrolase